MNSDSLALIEAAVRAPSSHNTQPWLFRVREGAVEVHADRSRALPVNDPHDRELIISCGAALFNVEAAAARAGIGMETTLLPESDSPDHLATASFGSDPETERGALADAIPARRSTREAFEDRSIPGGLGTELAALAERHEGCHLALVEADALREEVAGLVAEGDRVQFGDASWRRELAHSFRPRSESDGLTVSRFVGPVARTALRHLDLGRYVAGNDRSLAREAPLLVALWSDRDDARAWLETRQLLEAVSLRAAVDDVQAGYLNQPCQVAALRPRLREILGIAGFPQVLMRFGQAPDVDQLSPRRPVEDVLLGNHA